MKVIFSAMLLVLLVFSPGWAQLSYEGSSSIGHSLLPDLAAAFATKEKLQFDSIISNDSNLGFLAVKEGKAKIGGLSRMLREEELKENFTNQVIGYDAIAIYVNQANQVRGFTVEQLQNIFGGAITNWKDVGGADAAIKLVSKTGDEGGSSRHFQDLVMDGKPLAKPAIEATDRSDCVQKVLSEKDAITFASVVFKGDGAPMASVNGILPEGDKLRTGEYLLSRPYNLVIKNAEDPQIAKFMEFVFSEDGQKIVAKYAMPAVDFSEKK